MEINKVQWRMIAKGEKLPCDSFLMKKDGTITSMVTGAGVTVGQDAYYLPVDELRSFPKEENYDERMIQYFKDLAPFDKAEELYEKYGFSHKDAIDWLETQCKQKSADKVEQKFKVGDWFIKNNGSHINKDYNTCKISKIGNGYYTIESIYGYTGKIAFETFDENYHLWTIQDAKDGDVLCSGQIIVIFKHFEDPSYRQSILAYIGLDAIGNVQITDDTWTLGIDKVKPATKEQRDTLLKAMTNAGYTFDFEKKELKKSEQKSADIIPEDFERYVEQLLSLSDGEGHGRPAKVKEVTLKLLKLAKIEQHFAEWSEEDELAISRVISIVKWAAYSDHSHPILNDEGATELIERLKSLKDRYTYKPSKEQMKALYDSIPENVFEISEREQLLESLYQDLKKL